MAAIHLCLQGRNFGLKSGGTNSEGVRGAFGARGERGGELGWRLPFSTDSGVRESVVSSSSDRKRFYYNLISADRLCWQLVTTNSSLFLPQKVGIWYPSVQKVGVPVPLGVRIPKICSRRCPIVVANLEVWDTIQNSSCDTNCCDFMSPKASFSAQNAP